MRIKRLKLTGFNMGNAKLFGVHLLSGFSALWVDRAQFADCTLVVEDQEVRSAAPPPKP